jgi:hypothetical protein
LRTNLGCLPYEHSNEELMDVLNKCFVESYFEASQVGMRWEQVSPQKAAIDLPGTGRIWVKGTVFIT